MIRKTNGRILIIEDDHAMCKMLESDLSRHGFFVSWFLSGEEGFSALSNSVYDVILTDLNLPDLSGLELCKLCTENFPDIPVVIMTAFGSMETAISAIRVGAYDFITKPVDLDILALSLSRAVKHRKLEEKVNHLSDTLKQIQQFDDLIGESQQMKHLIKLIPRIAETDISVLITGQSGSGKELFARAVHNHSNRKNGPLTAINCSAMPENLLESELFGHVKGAFTDADKDRKGLFLEAEGGTLFLDEIGEMPLSLQPKLLRAIEEHKIRPVGSNREVSYNARIIAATNKDLEAAVADGTFREDLLYRLNVVQFEIPPLCDRGMDILLIANHFLEHFSKKLNKNVLTFSSQAAERLMNYNWPGNVRELRNAIEHAVAFSDYDTIVPEDLPAKIKGHHETSIPSGFFNPPELISIQEMERRYINYVLKQNNNNRTLTAKILNLDRKTLYRKLRSYDME